MDRHDWDERYRQKESVWALEPNPILVGEVEKLPAGRALDLAAGEGRNAVWLACRGWEVTAVDWSEVALEKGRARAGGAAVEVEWVLADLEEWKPPERAFDLVVITYLQPPPDLRVAVWRKAAAAVAPGGHLVVVGHDSSNLTRGWGGPADPVSLYVAADVVATVGGELEVMRAEEVQSPRETPEGPRFAIDNVVVAVRQAGRDRPSAQS
jgi:SAM-dependent methyltransferase